MCRLIRHFDGDPDSSGVRPTLSIIDLIMDGDIGNRTKCNGRARQKADQ